MKNMTKALIVGGLMVLAQTALANDSAFPGSSDEAGGRLPPRITYADRHAGDPVTMVGSAFPRAASEAGGRLPVKVTRADRYARDSVTTASSAFPGAAEDGIIQLPAKSTYADRHLDQPTRVSQPTQDSGISAN
jgi:hypothetical protein